MPSQPNASVLQRLPVAELLIGVALLIAATVSLSLTRVPGGIALFWPGSAIAAGLLIRRERVRWVSAAVASAAALALANLLAHRAPGVAALFSAIHCGEIALMVIAFRFVWRLPYPTISINQAAFMTAVLGIVIPGLAAAAGGVFLHLEFGTPWRAGFLQWWSAHTLGACMFGPPIILFSVKGAKRLARPKYLADNLFTWATCLVGCYLAIRYVRFPFVSISLLLMPAAFRVGGFGASLMSVSFGLLIGGLWALGIQPLGLDPNLSTQGTLIGLPVIALLATIMPPIAVGLGSDARRITARALRVSERRFRESMEYSPIGMLIADLDGTWRFTNRALQTMLGYSAEEFRAMPPGGPSKSDDWKRSQSRWSKLMAGEIQFYEATREFRHADGHWIWTHVAVSLLRDEDGVPIHLIAQIESLEARQMAEENLAAERERLKITLASINDAVITTDRDARITYANAAAEALLLVDLVDLMDKPVAEALRLVEPDSHAAASDLITQCTAHSAVARRDKPVLLRRADGSSCYVNDVVSPVLADGAGLSGLVIVLRDATLDVERSRTLQHRAAHDPLTGCSNRGDFNERLQAVFRRAASSDQPASVIAIDLDRFKAVNDSAGHAAGDAVLCRVADACRAHVRISDTVARLGGDEFAIILENCGEERAARIADQVLRALNPIALEWGTTTYLVHASLGLATTHANLADEAAWIEAADRACYLAKNQGRGRLRIAR